MEPMATRVRTEGLEPLLNRELSMLDFHGRVLELAANETMPLLERARFCAIFSSNIDEFFQVRVAGLLGQAESGLAMRSPDGLTPQQALARIRERVLELTARQSRIWKKGLRPGARCRGHRHRRYRGLRRAGARTARAPLPARDLPGTHTACSRPRTAVSVHLGTVPLTGDLRKRPR